MTIAYDNDGYIILNIPSGGSNEGKMLQNIDAYIACLNDSVYAISDINHYGCVTNTQQSDGFYIATTKNTFGVVLGHEFNPFIYRGENKCYEHFIPSAFRYNLSQEDEQVRHCIDYIKKQELIKLFKRTPYFKRCQQFSVLDCKFKFDFEAIAQHYEFISNYLDITKNLHTALFFAYTYQKNGKYYPITNFEEYSPTLYIGNLKKIYETYPENIKLIGFQALLRPKMQKAMALQINQEEDIKYLFEKFELPKSSAIAYEIYNTFQKGFLLFPTDYISKASREIKENHTLKSDLFNEYCNNHNLDKSLFLELIKKNGYVLTNEECDMPSQAKYMINREIDDHIIPYLCEAIHLRTISMPYKP